MTSKRLEQYRNLVGNFKAAKEFGYKVTGYAEWPTICIENADKLAEAAADLLARLEIAEAGLRRIHEMYLMGVRSKDAPICTNNDDGPTLQKAGFDFMEHPKYEHSFDWYFGEAKRVYDFVFAKINSDEEVK